MFIITNIYAKGHLTAVKLKLFLSTKKRRHPEKRDAFVIIPQHKQLYSFFRTKMTITEFQ